MQLLRIPEVWGAMLARALSGPVLHFYWYWLPEYLKRERHVSMQAIALLAAVPFLFAGLGNVAGSNAMACMLTWRSRFRYSGSQYQ